MDWPLPPVPACTWFLHARRKNVLAVLNSTANPFSLPIKTAVSQKYFTVVEWKSTEDAVKKINETLSLNSKEVYVVDHQVSPVAR